MFCLKNVKKCLKRFIVQDNRISVYFLPDLLPYVMRLCKNFLLWTKVINHIFKSPFKMAFFAPVENDFKELKRQLLKFDVCPMHRTDLWQNIY